IVEELRLGVCPSVDEVEGLGSTRPAVHARDERPEGRVTDVTIQPILGQVDIRVGLEVDAGNFHGDSFLLVTAFQVEEWRYRSSAAPLRYIERTSSSSTTGG